MTTRTNAAPRKRQPHSAAPQVEQQQLSTTDLKFYEFIFEGYQDSGEDLRDPLSDLDDSLYLFSQGGPRVRLGMILSLHAAIRITRKYLVEETSTSNVSSMLAPLNLLQTALWNLQDGIVHSALAPSQRTVAGGTRLSDTEREFRAMCCCAVDLKQKDGLSPEAAQRHVAAKLNKHGFTRQRRDRDNPSPITGATLHNWRKSGWLHLEMRSNDTRRTSWLIGHALAIPKSAREASLDALSDGSIADHLLDFVIPNSFGHLRADTSTSRKARHEE